MVIHYDEEGSCVVCANCGQYIRPSGMGGDCPGPRGPKPPDILHILSSAGEIVVE